MYKQITKRIDFGIKMILCCFHFRCLNIMKMRNSYQSNMRKTKDCDQSHIKKTGDSYQSNIRKTKCKREKAINHILGKRERQLSIKYLVKRATGASSPARWLAAVCIYIYILCYCIIKSPRP